MQNSPREWMPATSADEPLVIEACERFYERLLRLDPGVESILETATEFPDEPVVQIASAFLWLFGQTPEAQEQSAGYLAKAQAHRGRLNAREKQWLDALELWHARSFEAATVAFEAIATEWPNDLPAIKAVEFLYYVLGQQESGARFLALMQRLERRAGQYARDPDFLAIKAFAHELCGELRPARELAERALAITPHNPWAHHALEHVLLWEGSGDEAVDLAESWLGSWKQAGRFIHCHNAWHLALTHLDRLAPERAFAVYDEHVWGHAPGMVVEQLDAIAFLWRAEMAGVPVGQERYRAILPHVLPLAETLFMPFVSAHYAYLLARAGEGEALEAMLRRVAERAEGVDHEAVHVWAPVGRSIVNGVAELGRGNAAAAAQWMDPVMDRMLRIGGSDAQDDLFRFAHWESLRCAGRKADARARLEQRLSLKRPSPLEQKLLADWS